MSERKLYFPNLNGVRAIAAFMVIIFHIELIKCEFGIKNFLGYTHLGGDLGVILFFVLSGFLITYLLMEEEKLTNKISLKNFYIRRILRIWPLYFFITISCLFILPHISYLYEPSYNLNPVIQSRLIQVLLYFFFLSNVLTGLFSHVNFARPTWSVSVEEQFYLFWPILLKFSKNKAKVIRNVFLLYWIIRILTKIVKTNFFMSHFPSLNFLSHLEVIWLYTPFDILSVGAFTGYILYKKTERILKIVYNKYVQVVVFILLPILIYILRFSFTINIGNFQSDDLNNLAYSILFAILIVNLAGNPKVIINLENRILNYLGKISYGLYLYHWVVVVFIINILKKTTLNTNSIAYNLILYGLCIGSTIATAHISYIFFELKFLSLKHKFSVIISGDMVNK
jgi:peptidoglycan/LPS O-acetylase OafA/YrhL